jgi:hypothetical protein
MQSNRAEMAKVELRAYPNNPLYPQGKPDACVVGEKTFSTWRKPRLRAFLACRLGLPDISGLGLITTRLFG